MTVDQYAGRSDWDIITEPYRVNFFPRFIWDLELFRMFLALLQDRNKAFFCLSRPSALSYNVLNLYKS